MVNYQNHELPEGYRLDEETGFIQILTSQDFPEPTEDLPHFERALGSVRTYLHSILENNFCPFVKGIEARDGYYVYPEFSQVGEETLPVLAQAAERALIHLAGPSFHDPMKTKFLSTIIAFNHPKNRNSEFYKLMDDFREKTRLSILRKGLMLSQMHPDHPPETIGGHEGNPYAPKIPLLIVRAMHVKDLVFMKTEAERAAYQNIFSRKELD